MKNILSSLILLFTGITLSWAQPVNDNCTTATSIGSLPVPAACPGGNGVTITVSGTTVGGTSSSPYPYMVGCSTGGQQQSPGIDVWYTFVATGTILNLNLTSTFASPNIGLWTGTCNDLAGLDCAKGSAGGVLNYSTPAITPGQTYYIQISGNTSSATGTFNLTLDNDMDCNNCLTTATIVATPAPVNGTYQPGQSVQVCFTVNGFTQVSNNWLHGLEYTFGPGWDLSTLVTGTPTECGSNPAGPGNGSGTWSWVNSVTQSISPFNVHGPGYFFESAEDGDPLLNPGNNYGDYTAGVTTCTWTFCITLNVSTTCVQDQSLEITFNTLADGESGSWTSLACTGDPNFTFNALMTCCPPPTMTHTNETCNGGADGTATATGSGASPWDYSWVNSSGTNIGTTNNVAGPNTISGLAVGSYTVTVTDNNGCVSTGSVTITQPSPSIMTSASTATICSGGTVSIPLTSDINSSYTWIASDNANTTGESLTLESTSTLSNTIINISSVSQTVTYTVTPTSTVGNCPGTPQIVTVTVKPAPTMTSANAATICSGGTVSIPLTSNINSSYTWIAADNANTTGESLTLQSTNTLSNTITNISAAVQTLTYTVIPTSSTGSCVGADQIVTVTVNPLPVISGTATITSASCGSSDGTITGLTATGLGTLTYTWSNAVPTVVSTSTITADLTGQPAGSYTLVVTTSANSCSSTAGPFSIGNAGAPIAPIAGSTTPICEGSQLNITSNTIVGATYSWTGPNGFTSSAEDTTVSINATTAMAGTYSVTITIAGCTSLPGTTTVVVNAIPSAPTAGSNSPICEGSQLDLTSNTIGGAIYSWTGPNGFTSALEDPTVSANATVAMTGTYSVTATVASCTSLPGTISVVVNPIPTAPTAGSNSPICIGSQLDLTSNTIASGTYSWTGPNGFTSSAEDTTVSTNATVAMAGTYSVTVTVAGCTSLPGTTVVTTTIPTAPVAGSNSPVCEGSQLDLNSNTIAGATYSWTGPNGFTSSAEDTTVSINSTLAMDGTYSVTSTVGGCTSLPGTVTVTINPLPSAPAAGNNGPICEGSQLDISSNTSAGVTYSWTGPNGFTSFAEDTTVSANATLAMAGTYSVTATVAGCTSLAGTTIVVVNTIPATPTAGSNSPVCEGSQLDLNSNTIAGATYSWTGPNTFTSSLEDPTVNATATTAMAGTYSVTATVAGCTSLAGTTTVVVNTTPTAPTAGSNSPVCVGSQLDLNANTIAGATYSWTGPNGFVSSVEDPTVSANATTAMAGTYSVTATVAGCTSLAGTTTVIVNTIPAAPTAGSNSPVCVGSPLGLTSTTIAGGTYSWTGPNGFVSSSEDPAVSPNATTAMAGTYSVTVIVAGCTSLPGTTSVLVNNLPATPTAGSNSPVCAGSQLDLLSNTVAGATYSWTGPNGFVSAAEDTTVSVNATTAMAGTYSVTVTVGGCTSLAGTTVVSINPAPVASFTTSPDPATGTEPLVVGFINTSQNANTYSWVFGDGNTSISPNPPTETYAIGTYTVVLTASDNTTSCTSTTSVIVFVYENYSIAIPNVFSPNGDNNNDVFKVISTGVTKIDGEIFDRWGLKMNKWNGAGAGWDGRTSSGIVAKDGTYYYIIKTTASDGENHEYKGFVQLVR